MNECHRTLFKIGSDLRVANRLYAFYRLGSGTCQSSGRYAALSSCLHYSQWVIILTMPKKFRNTKCVHCLRYFELLSSDHVFPLSWYPDNTPENEEKWQVPSCKECNGKLGKLERDLITRFPLGFGNHNPNAVGLYPKAIRCMNPKAGKNEKDSKHRLKKKMQILNQFIPADKLPSNCFIPNKLMEKPPPNATGLLIPYNELNTVIEKIIRGFSYYTHKLYIDEQHKITIQFLSGSGINPIRALLAKFGSVTSLGPGIRVEAAFCPDDMQCALYYFEFWGAIPVYAFIEQLNNSAW